MDMIVSMHVTDFNAVSSDVDSKLKNGRRSIKWNEIHSEYTSKSALLLLVLLQLNEEARKKPLRVKILDSFWPHVSFFLSKNSINTVCSDVVCWLHGLLKKNSGTQGGRQLNILFGCIASLHPEKKAKSMKNKAKWKWKRWREKDMVAKRTLVMFLPRKIQTEAAAAAERLETKK